MYQYVWLFFVYSVLGWGFMTIVAAVNRKKLIDVGALYGPYCPAYGIAAVLFTVFLDELRDNLFFLFLGGMLLSMLIVYMTGIVLERIFHQKWWDYSRKRFSFAGYVNVPYGIVWGAGAVFCISIGNPLIRSLLNWIPDWFEKPAAIALLVLIGLDLFGTLAGIYQVKKSLKNTIMVAEVSETLQRTSERMGGRLAEWTLRRLEKAYPALERKKIVEAQLAEEKRREKEKAKAGVFAVGCSFHKLFCIFMLGSFLGDITETIFCFVTSGVIMSRSSVVYGPFSLVWGIGCVLLTALLYQYRKSSDRFLFLFGTLLGGAYEYICSVFTELVFGTVFWDYSHIPFNLGGRINLLYCFFWGIVAVVWMKLLYPKLSIWIEKIPKKIGIWMNRALIVFMIVNVIISAIAMSQYSLRQSKAAYETNAVTTFFDTHFPDERMQKIYPNAKFTK